MTIEQANKLLQSEQQNMLRVPACITAEQIDKQEEIHNIIWLIYFYMQRNRLTKRGKSVNIEDLVRSEKIRMFCPSLKNIAGKGTKARPYLLKTSFGDGLIMDTEEVFSKNDIQNFVKGECFKNAREFSVMYRILDAKMLSGIVFVGKQFLHSVVKITFNKKDWIVDFNYDFIMEYSLYKNLFAFEELNEVKGTTIDNDCKAISKARTEQKITTNDFLLAFAYEDVLQDVFAKLGTKRPVGDDGGVGV